MNIRFVFLFVFAFSCGAILHAEQPESLYTPKQHTILLLNSLSGPLWKSTAPYRDIDPIFKLQSGLSALPGIPTTASLFVMRNPEVARASHYLNPQALENTVLAPLATYINDVIIQEHTAGIHLGQLWHQDNWEIAWQWWVGARERNWWINGKSRGDFLKELNTAHFDKGAQTTPDAHAPQQHTHRFTATHATSTNIGIGDVHVQIRYRIPLGNRVSCAIGAYATVPIGTHAKRRTIGIEEALPMEDGNELALKLVNRLRDVMLCVPLGSNGHLGLGGQLLAQVVVTNHFHIRGQWTQVYYRGDIENRYALTPHTPLTPIEEGMPFTAEGASPSDLVFQHLKQRLYPTEIKTHVYPGMVRIGTIGLHYENIPFHGSFSYSHESSETEYSELAPLATLTPMRTENHRLNTIVGWRKRFDWGESSSFLHGYYTIAGTHKGAWGAMLGVTVQA